MITRCASTPAGDEGEIEQQMAAPDMDDRRFQEDTGERLEELRGDVGMGRGRHVVQDQTAVRRQSAPGRFQRLHRVDVIVEPHGAHARQERLAVQRPEHDEVVGPRSRLEERAGVGDMGLNARVRVGALKMQPSTQLSDLGIDLDGVDVLRPQLQQEGDVVPGAGAQHQHGVQPLHVLVRRAIACLGASHPGRCVRATP